MSWSFLAKNSKFITTSKSTIYNWIDGGLLSCKNIDLVRGKNKQKPKKPTGKVSYNKAKVGKKYEDYLQLVLGDGVWQMDTVKGKRETESIITLIEIKTSFLLMFVLPEKASKQLKMFLITLKVKLVMIYSKRFLK